MSLIRRWVNSLGRKSPPAIHPPRYRPILEPLGERVVPHGGPGWPNVLTVSLGGHFAGPSRPDDTEQTATHFAVFAQRDVSAGSELRVTVVAVDGHNRPVKGYTGSVDLTSTDGSAVLPAEYTFTAEDRGRHTFAVTLNTEGSQTITATDTADPAVAGSVAVTVDPARVATHLFVSIERNAYAGSAARVVVAVLDADNRRVTGYTGTVQFTSSDASAVLPADYTFSASDRGVKVFAVTPGAAGELTVTATDAADSSISGSATITVKETQVVTHFALLVRPGAAVGEETRVFVVALDASNRPVKSFTGTVRFSSSDSAATLPAEYTFTADDRGMMSFALTFATTGMQTLSVEDVTNADVAGSATVHVRAVSEHGRFIGGPKFHRWQ